VTNWVTDRIAPPYWIPNSQITVSQCMFCCYIVLYLLHNHSIAEVAVMCHFHVFVPLCGMLVGDLLHMHLCLCVFSTVSGCYFNLYVVSTVSSVCVCVIDRTVPSVKCRLRRSYRSITAVLVGVASVRRVPVIVGRCQSVTGAWNQSASVTSAMNLLQEHSLVQQLSFCLCIYPYLVNKDSK